MDLRELLARRSDLSTFLVHLTREGAGQSARDRLTAILDAAAIQARTVYGQAKSAGLRLKADKDSQKVVCFTETPLEYLHLLVVPIANRHFQFQPYGIGLTKKLGRKAGVNPIWYVDISPGHNWLTKPLNKLVESALNSGSFATSDIAKITPFIEQMGSQSGSYTKEFWWEREWRHQGDFDLPARFIVLAPEEDFDHFQGRLEENNQSASCIDPRWSLEQIIARLSGFAPDQIDLP